MAARAVVVLAATSAMATAACEGRAPRATSVETRSGRSSSDGPLVAEIDLSRGVPEARSTSILGSPSRRSHVDLVRALRALAEDRGSAPVKGIFVRFGVASTGLARAQEIGHLLGEIRKTKPVVCHADEYDNASMALAARGCSKIWVSPAGGVETIGIAAQMLYANSLLERLHVGVDFLQIGKYKGAEEPFTRDGPSPEARSSLESALRGMRAGWLADVAEGRGKLSAAGAVEDGPFAPQEAMERGLVDAVGYLDDAREDAKKLTSAERIASRFGGGEGSRGGGGGLASLLRALAGSSHIGTPHVAVVPASGSIAMSSSGSILGGSDGITERELGKLITKLTSDSSTKAVVLRIDSPGGSALASDLLWKKLMKLREKKTLVVSVGDMAASGGYYLSCAGHKIVAEPTSLLGSIGVVGGKLAVGRTLEQIGVHAETIAAAPDPQKAARASYESSMTPWDDDTRARVLATMTSVYNLFLERVAEGRGTTVDKITPNAEGRVYGGVEAKERGMVDAIGGLSDAVDLAIQLAGLPKDAPIDVVDDEPGLFELLDEGTVPGAGEASAAVTEGAKRVAQESLIPPLLNQVLPAARPFLGAFAPLLAGERVITAVPYGVTVR
ncbi:signal peptide peptidase SppA [Minicystis rosea]|nr:signal peptide peptidase SppA [Minicystis rosea]